MVKLVMDLLLIENKKIKNKGTVVEKCRSVENLIDFQSITTDSNGNCQ